jgi:hypothetical protein
MTRAQPHKGWGQANVSGRFGPPFPLLFPETSSHPPGRPSGDAAGATPSTRTGPPPPPRQLRSGDRSPAQGTPGRGLPWVVP